VLKQGLGSEDPSGADAGRLNSAAATTCTRPHLTSCCEAFVHLDSNAVGRCTINTHAVRLNAQVTIHQVHAVQMASVLLCRLLLALADVEQETSNWAQVIQLAQAASRAAQDAEVTCHL
jgi:hypothetical protein